MAELRQNTWSLDEWYDQAVAGTTGGYGSYINGEFWTWGNQDKGELGQNQTSNQYSSPKQVPGTWRDMVVQTGQFNAEGGVKSDGTLWTWGRNVGGLLGHNDTVDRSSPVQVGTDTSWGGRSDEDFGPGNAKFMVGGGTCCHFIKNDGTLWSWGYNSYGGLGLNSASGQGKVSSPTQVGTDTTWKYIGGTATAIFSVKTDGTLWAWGGTIYGTLGLNQESPSIQYSSPVQIPGTNWASVAGGVMNCGFTKTDGTGWMTGINNYGMLGLNTINDHRSSPVQIGTDTTWKQVYGGGEDYGFGLKTDGTAWSWGRNEGGLLGLNNGGGDPSSVSSPTQIGANTTWKTLSNSRGISTGMKTDGTIWTWGSNGQYLGKNWPSNYKRSSPVQVPGTYHRLTTGQESVVLIKST
jgi:alpha-tubulin suppressor-like RCC1 family protein